MFVAGIRLKTLETFWEKKGEKWNHVWLFCCMLDRKIQEGRKMLILADGSLLEWVFSCLFESWSDR